MGIKPPNGGCFFFMIVPMRNDLYSRVRPPRTKGRNKGGVMSLLKKFSEMEFFTDLPKAVVKEYETMVDDMYLEWEGINPSFRPYGHLDDILVLLNFSSLAIEERFTGNDLFLSIKFKDKSGKMEFKSLLHFNLVAGSINLDPETLFETSKPIVWKNGQNRLGDSAYVLIYWIILQTIKYIRDTRRTEISVVGADLSEEHLQNYIAQKLVEEQICQEYESDEYAEYLAYVNEEEEL
jgi:hypothetical protein